MQSDVLEALFHLDHVQVSCRSSGKVVISVYDDATDTLSTWVMSFADDGWSMQASTVPVDGGSATIN